VEAVTDGLERAEAASAHCYFALQENQTLKNQLNAVTNKKQRRTLRTHIANLTGDEAQRLWDQQETEDQVKETQKAARNKARTEKAAETQRRRAHLALLGPAARFEKTLSSCKRSDLEDLIIALGLMIEDKDTAKTLHAKLVDKFSIEPHLKLDPRFSGIFSSSRGRRRLPSSENVAPSPLSLSL